MKFSCSILLSVQKTDSNDPTSISVGPVTVSYSKKTSSDVLRDTITVCFLKTDSDGADSERSVSNCLVDSQI
jgi:hypothetical protein